MGALALVPWAGVVAVPSSPDGRDVWAVWASAHQRGGQTLACSDPWPGAALLCFRAPRGERLTLVTTDDLGRWRSDTVALGAEARVALVARAPEIIERLTVVGTAQTYLRLADRLGGAALVWLAPEVVAAAAGGIPLQVAVPSEEVALVWRHGDPELDLILAVGAVDLFDAAGARGVSKAVWTWDGKHWFPLGEAVRPDPPTAKP